MYRTLKAAMALSLMWAGNVCAAMPQPPELSEAEQAALNACFELPDEQAAAECLEALQLPLPPEMQRFVDLAADPAIRAANERWQQTADTATRAHIDALAATGTPRNLLAAVLLSRPEATDANPRPGAMSDFTLVLPEHVVGWFDAARHATPADPLVAWWEATGCVVANLDCDSAGATSRLLQVDADNSAVQLLALHAAHSAGDVVAARTHLRLAAEAGRFEPYDLALLELVLEAKAGVALPPLPVEVAEALGVAYGFDRPITGGDIHAVEAMGQWAALSLMPLQSLSRMCGPGDQMEAALKQDCLAVLQQVASGPNMGIYPAFALDLLVRLTADDTAGTRWRERLREYAWLSERALSLLVQGRALPPSEQARLWVENGEIGAWHAMLVEHDIAAEPPADWLPEDTHKRALITTGREPPAG